MIESLKLDEIAPKKLGKLGLDDLDNPIVVFVIPESKIGDEFVTKELGGLNRVTGDNEVYLSPDGTEFLSIPT